MIDWSRVRELRDEIGADEFDEVVEIFLDEVETEIATLRDKSDPEHLEAQLHFLKGSAMNLGFQEFSDLCQKGEAAAGRDEAGKVDLREILDSYGRSRAAFMAGLPDVSSG